jgi:gluconolactonase
MTKFVSVGLPIAGSIIALHLAAATFDIRIPDEFNQVVDTNTVLVTNGYVNAWIEGPVWVPADGGYLVFSAMDTSNKLMKLVPPYGISVFLSPPANTLYNGNLLDAQERLISCQAGGAGLRVVMTTNGVITPLASTCAGLKFYSPNDLAIKSDGTIWFTDPGYNGGIGSPPQPGFQKGYYVYRFDPSNGNATCTAVITNGIIRPNGICFSPDESLLYVADSDTSRHRILRYSVSSSNTLSGGAVFATIANGIPDGIKCDAQGRVYSSSATGVQIYLPDGRLIGAILIPNTVPNLCFGDADWKTLYIVAQPQVYSIRLQVAGEPSIKHLQIQSTAGGPPAIFWPAPSTGFQLETTTDLKDWSVVPDPPVVSNGMKIVTLDTTNAAAFFRLDKVVP